MATGTSPENMCMHCTHVHAMKIAAIGQKKRGSRDSTRLVQVTQAKVDLTTLVKTRDDQSAKDTNLQLTYTRPAYDVRCPCVGSHIRRHAYHMRQNALGVMATRATIMGAGPVTHREVTQLAGGNAHYEGYA